MRYSEEESSIRVEIEKRSRGLVFSVIDNGVGIPKEELYLIFDKFTQSSKTKTGAGGTGLGLAICEQIISRHGGRIWAENNPDGGSIFRFFIPFEKTNVTDH